jgi:hypothetical protein
MNVFRHHHVSVDRQIETAAHVLKTVNKDLEQIDRRKVWPALVTTKSYKVGLAGLLKAPETPRHETNLHPVRQQVNRFPG